MAIKTILTIYDGVDSAMSRLDAAIALAAKHDAHLTVFCFSSNIVVHPNAVAGVGSASVPSMIEEAQKELDRLKAELSKHMSLSSVRYDIHPEICFPGRAGDDIAEQARFTDLVVLPDASAGPWQESRKEIAETTMFAAEARVLLVPAGFDGGIDGPVVIGWDGKREAMQAVRAALPFLEAAPSVEIVTVNSDPDMPPAADLATYLSRHGVTVNLVEKPKGKDGVKATISGHAKDVSASMMVLGAYGHSRLRQLVFGGVTSKVLTGVTLPTLLAR